MTLLSVGIVCALLVAFATLWTRRLTWRSQWELAPTLNVAGMALCLLLIPPYIDWLWNPPLHRLFGVWNINDLLGHLAYLIGIAALAYTLISRLDLDVRRFLRARLELPATVIIPTLIGLFWWGRPSAAIPDLIGEGMTGRMVWYWLLLCAGSAWVLLHAGWALIIIRQDPRSRRVADLYLVAVAADAMFVASLLVSVLWSDWPHLVAWAMVALASVAYSLVALYSWRRKIGWFTRARRDLNHPDGLPS